MAQINILGEYKKPYYIKAEKEKPFISSVLLYSIAVTSLNNTDYLQFIFNLLHLASGVTTVLFKILIDLLILFPWIKMCYFIGQYTKKSYLNLVHMCPIVGGATILHYVAAPLLAALSTSLPPITGLLSEPLFMNTEYKNNLLYQCISEMKENLTRMGEIPCSPSDPVIYPVQCYIMKAKLMDLPKSIIDDWFSLVSGTIVISLLLLTSMTTFCQVFHATAFCYMVLILLITLIGKINATDLKNILSKVFLLETQIGAEVLGVPEIYPLFTWDIRSLTIATPVLIMVGSYLPVDAKSSVSAIITCAIQCFYILYLFYAFIGNLSAISQAHDLPLQCLKPYNTSIVAAHIVSSRGVVEMVLSANNYPLLISNILIFCNAASIRFLNLLFLAVHAFAAKYALLETFKILKKRYILNLIVTIIISVSINTTAIFAILDHPHHPALHKEYNDLLTVCLSLTFIVTCTVIYGGKIINIDNIFLYGVPMTLISQWQLRVLPLMIVIFALWTIYDYKTDIIYINNKEATIPWHVERSYYVLPLTAVFVAVLLYGLIVIIQASVGKKLNSAFLPTKHWGPWSPEGQNVLLERKNFHPETAVRFEGNYYKCRHNCWLAKETIKKEIKECDEVYVTVENDIKNINVKKITPELYTKYKSEIASIKKSVK